jgi:hypothetical protein
MTLRITPAVLEAAYTLLRATAPFNRWKLPPADDVVFRVVRRVGNNPDIWAQHLSERQVNKPKIAKGRHLIDVNETKVATLATLIPLMAHEIVHIRESMLISYTGEAHGATFKKLAAEVCRHHGFDPRAF